MMSRSALVGAVVLVGMALLVGVYATDYGQNRSLFPDPQLEAAVREAIKKPFGEITPADLVGLTELLAPNRGVQDLEGLQYCTALVHLDLGYESVGGRSVNSNQITDLTPLAGLTNLTGLELSNNQITDLTPLAGLTNLTGLYLYKNQITDLTPLAGLTDLTELWLNKNQITDLTPLAGLTNLTRLLVAANEITDLTPLAGLTNLTGLFLNNNQITDLTPLAGLTKIETLDLRLNLLDLTPGFPATHIIKLFQDRGANVRYEPQN